MLKYFTISELCTSAAAARQGLRNDPPLDCIRRMEDGIRRLLDPIREQWGGPIYVNSGYRSRDVNAAVGGVALSQHMRGEAADITAGSAAANARLYAQIRDSDLPYDQLINERPTADGPRWVHVSWTATRTPRRQAFTIK